MAVDMFSLARHIYQSNPTMREGKWDKNKCRGIELSGKISGLVGFGRIEIETAKIAKAIKMVNLLLTAQGVE